MQRLFLAALILGSSSWPITASAADMVYRQGEKNAVQGEITRTSKTEVVIKPRVGSEESIPANEITRVRFDGEPPKLNLTRSHEAVGRLDAAIAGYREVQEEVGSSDPRIKSDLEFLIARVLAKQALNDEKLRDEAIAALDDFREKNSNSFRYYEALWHLGRVQLAKRDFANAEQIFTQLEVAPWPDYKMAAQIGSARVLLEQGQIAPAQAKFESVANGPANTAAQKLRQYEAKLGLANCLRRQNQFEQAIQTLDEVSQQSAADDSAIQAEAFLRKGDCLQAQGESKKALLAYLHVDVLYANETEQHAEALFRLTQLWSSVGQPGRASDAAGRLNSLYGNSEWAKKLSTGG